ncbi:DUF4291 family protein [Streptomyces sp. NPDC057697]|uniref:DUF4291 family protein n=1 Tax=Streptomyces sp. NPDC057697 TaxID=3346219 RepID=UPI0036CB11B6
MTAQHHVRADYDDRTIVVYQAQAYAPAVAGPALRANRFVPPFSFRWLTHRSNRARKPGRERILAVRITRAGWEAALASAVPTTAGPAAVAKAPVQVQWDPERSLRGAALNHYSIQVGVGRTFAEEWVVGLSDLTPRVQRIAALRQDGRSAQAQRLLPPERIHPVPPASDVDAERLGIDV